MKKLNHWASFVCQGEVGKGDLWEWNHGRDVDKCGGKKKEKTPTAEIQPHRGDQDNWAEEEAILYLKRNF